MTPLQVCDWQGILLALAAAIMPLVCAWWLMGTSGATRKASRILRSRK